MVAFQPLRGPGSGLGQQACWELESWQHGVCQREIYQEDVGDGQGAGQGEEEETINNVHRGRGSGEKRGEKGTRANDQ